MHRFRVEVIAKTPNPQQVIYAAMHQDYTDGFVFDERDSWPSESQSGEVIVKRLLAGERGHMAWSIPRLFSTVATSPTVSCSRLVLIV